MAMTYQDYYKSAMQRYQPQRESDISDASAGLADKGLLASTGGQGALADIRAKYNALAAQQASQDAYQQQGIDANARQEVRQWYDLINSAQLSKIGADVYKNPRKVKWMSQPTWLRSMQNNAGLQYGDGKGEVVAPIGDGKGKVDDGWRVDSFTDSNLQRTGAARNADRDYSLAKAELALRQRQYEDSRRDAESGDDPWQAMAQLAAENNAIATSTVDLDPNTPGIQRDMHYQPTALLARFNAEFGIDVMDAAKRGDRRAMAIVSLLYPKTWIPRVDAGGTSWDEYKSSLMRPDESAAPTQSSQLMAGDAFTPNTEGRWQYGYDSVPSSTYAMSNLRGPALVNPNPFRR